MSVEFSPEPPVADLARRTAEFIRETLIPVEEQCREQGHSAAQATSIAKTFCAEAVSRIVNRSLQICGSLGISGDILLSRFLRELCPFRICDGPSETYRWVIARRAVRQHVRAAR
jgi:acyl-CoA dehydrogenase